MSQKSSQDAAAPIDDEIKDDPLAELARIVSAGSVFGAIPETNPQSVTAPEHGAQSINEQKSSSELEAVEFVSDLPDVPDVNEALPIEPEFIQQPEAVAVELEEPAFMAPSQDAVAVSEASPDDLELALSNQLEAELFNELQVDPSISQSDPLTADNKNLDVVVTELASEPLVDDGVDVSVLPTEEALSHEEVLSSVDVSLPEEMHVDAAETIDDTVLSVEQSVLNAAPETVSISESNETAAGVEDVEKPDAIEKALNLDSFFDSEFAAATNDLTSPANTNFDAGFPDVADETPVEENVEPITSALVADMAADLNVNSGDVDPLDTINLEPAEENFSFDSVENNETGRSKPLLAIAAVLLVAVVGGVAAYSLLGVGEDGDGDVVIAASDEPVRVKPTDPGGKEIPNQDRTVYETISGNEKPEEPSGDLVDRSETLIVGVDNETEKLTPRVVLPGPSSDAPLISSTKPPRGPRTVRTVVVRPDGSIVPETNTQTATNGQTVTDVTPQATAPEQRSTLPSIVSSTDDTVTPREVVTEIIAEPAAPVVVETKPVTKPEPVAEVEVAAVEPPAADPAPFTPGHKAVVIPLPRANTFRASRRQAAAQEAVSSTSNDPIDLQPATPVQRSSPPTPVASVPAARTPVASAPKPNSNGNFVVQLSSQRSEEQARTTFRGLQRRFSLLSAYSPIIQRADLGSRGVYHRLQVGRFATRADAISLCENLKAAGGDCIISRN